MNGIFLKTTQTTPAKATHCSTRTMARERGICEASELRIRHAHGPKQHLLETFKIRRDPELADKLETIVSLYLSPPQPGSVLCTDERNHLQGLDRRVRRDSGETTGAQAPPNKRATV
jgi:hypothetical protein